MPRFIMIALLLAGILATQPGTCQTSTKSLVDSLTKGGPPAVSSTMPVIDTANSIDQQFKRIGKAAIPDLIDAIDRDAKGFVGFVDQRSSNMYLNAGNYTGIKAAYMIEYLLSDSSDYQIYPIGVIVPFNHGSADYKLLTLHDIKAVKKYYQTWWNASKDKSMKKLQLDWSAGKRPLTGARYGWL